MDPTTSQKSFVSSMSFNIRPKTSSEANKPLFINPSSTTIVIALPSSDPYNHSSPTTRTLTAPKTYSEKDEPSFTETKLPALDNIADCSESNFPQQYEGRETDIPCQQTVRLYKGHVKQKSKTFMTQSKLQYGECKSSLHPLHESLQGIIAEKSLSLAKPVGHDDVHPSQVLEIDEVNCDISKSINNLFTHKDNGNAHPSTTACPKEEFMTVCQNNVKHQKTYFGSDEAVRSFSELHCSQIASDDVVKFDHLKETATLFESEVKNDNVLHQSQFVYYDQPQAKLIQPCKNQFETKSLGELSVSENPPHPSVSVCKALTTSNRVDNELFDADFVGQANSYCDFIDPIVKPMQAKFENGYTCLDRHLHSSQLIEKGVCKRTEESVDETHNLHESQIIPPEEYNMIDTDVNEMAYKFMVIPLSELNDTQKHESQIVAEDLFIGSVKPLSDVFEEPQTRNRKQLHSSQVVGKDIEVTHCEHEYLNNDDTRNSPNQLHSSQKVDYAIEGNGQDIEPIAYQPVKIKTKGVPESVIAAGHCYVEEDGDVLSIRSSSATPDFLSYSRSNSPATFRVMNTDSIVKTAKVMDVNEGITRQLSRESVSRCSDVSDGIAKKEYLTAYELSRHKHKEEEQNLRNETVGQWIFSENKETGNLKDACNLKEAESEENTASLQSRCDYSESSCVYQENRREETNENVTVTAGSRTVQSDTFEEQINEESEACFVEMLQNEEVSLHRETLSMEQTDETNKMLPPSNLNLSYYMSDDIETFEQSKFSPSLPSLPSTPPGFFDDVWCDLPLPPPPPEL